MGVHLTTSQRSELLSELRKERERKYADRIRVILLLDEGKRHKDIADFLFLDEKTVANWKKRYDEGGIEKLVNDHYMGRVTLLSREQLQTLCAELDSKIYPSTHTIIAYVKNKFGIDYTTGGMTSLLHRLGFSYKKPKGVPAKANAKEQTKFLRKYRRAKGYGLVYFADSTHPMLGPVLTSAWSKRGEETFVKTSSGRQRVNVNGAIELTKQDVIMRTCKTVNKRSMSELLRAIRRKNPDEKYLYIVLDNAPYNRARSLKSLAKKLKIKILYLPPYSPNLNPIERLWKFMKKKLLANRYYESLEEFSKSVSEFFRCIRKYWSELETLLTDSFQIIQA